MRLTLVMIPALCVLAALPARAQVVDEVDAVGCSAGDCQAELRPEEPVVVEAKEDAECQRRFPRPVTSDGAPLTGRVEVEYQVHSDGSVNDIKQRGQGPALLFQSVKEWLATCHFSPATADGKPVAMGMKQAFSFRMQEQVHRDQAADTKGAGLAAPPPADPNEPVRQIGKSVSFPRLSAECMAGRPIRHPAGLSGLVQVEFVVHSDGRVGAVENKTPQAPPALYEAVREWLLQCRYLPSREGDKPVAVKMLQPFSFPKRAAAR